MNEDLSRLMDGDLDETELDRVAGEYSWWTST